MISHYVSLSSMVAGCCFPVFTLISPKVNDSVPFVVFSFVIAVLLLVTHRKNIERLLHGTESKSTSGNPDRPTRTRRRRRRKPACSVRHSVCSMTASCGTLRREKRPNAHARMRARTQSDKVGPKQAQPRAEGSPGRGCSARGDKTGARDDAPQSEHAGRPRPR